MELQEHELVCRGCEGSGIKDNDEIALVVCQKCGGSGKVDWISNAMGSVPSIIQGVTFQQPPSDINFCCDNEEVLRITKDAFYIKGNKIADDNKIYDAFVDFFKQCGTYI